LDPAMYYSQVYDELINPFLLHTIYYFYISILIN